MNQIEHIAELEAMWRAMGERIAKLRAEAANEPKPVVDRPPPPEAFARVAALRRRRGHAHGA